MDRETLLDLIPAYALGALDPEERAQVEALLASDDEARALLAEYQEFSDLLVLTVPAQKAPAHLSDDLRARLMAGKSSAPPPIPLDFPRPGLRKNRWLAPLLTAAAMLVIVLAGALLLSRFSLPASDPGAALYQSLIGQDGATRIALVSESAPISGELVASRDGATAVIYVQQLPPLDSERAFQLWLINDQGAHSGGLLENIQSDGKGYIILPLDGTALSDYQAFAVSIEPQGGSPQPTGDIVFSVPASV